MQEIAMATDAQLRAAAQSKAYGDYAKSPRRKAEYNFATMLPVMDSFLVGATAPGSLKNKVLTGGKQLKDWGIFLVVANLYHSAINKIVSKSETLQNFKENSPFAFGITNTVLGVTAGISGIHLVNKGCQKFISPIIPQQVKEFTKGLANSMDNSSVGQSVNEGMKRFAKNYPKITKTFGVAAVWTLPILCLGMMGVMAYDAIKAKFTENRTYKELEGARLAAAQQLAMQKQGEE